jgi:hypothetical protein
MNRPFLLLAPMVPCLASKNPHREQENTVDRMGGKVERLQRIPDQSNCSKLLHDLTESELHLGRAITVD